VQAGAVTVVVAFKLYVGWAYVPTAALSSLGITYYPSKEWAIAVPAWCVVAVVMLVCVYEASNMLLVPPLDSRSLIARGIVKGRQLDYPELNKHSTKYACADIAPGTVNNYLYSVQGEQQRTREGLT
jgi:phosphatidylinositol N-acetylglucosaminyltransferase subunit P